MKKKFVKKLFVRRLFIALILLLQLLFIIYIIFSSNKSSDIVGYIFTAISIFAALHVVSKAAPVRLSLHGYF